MNEKKFYRYEGKYFRENEPRLISRGCTIHTKKVTMSDSSRFSADGRAGEKSTGVQSVHLLSKDGEIGYSESRHEGNVLFGRQYSYQRTAKHGGGIPKRQGTGVPYLAESRWIGAKPHGGKLCDSSGPVVESRY